MLALFAALAALGGLAIAQENPGHWTMNASIPKTEPSTSGCVILAQLTNSMTPPTLQAMYPICPPDTPAPTEPAEGAELPWPIAGNANDGDALKSSLAIYGQIKHKADRTDVYMAQAGCVMLLGKDQAQYMLNRSLTWNNELHELWDNTDNGFVLTPDGSANMAW